MARATSTSPISTESTSRRSRRATSTNESASETECCAPLAAPAANLDLAATASAVATLRALGDPTRLGLMALLAAQREPVCVCELVAHFALGQPTISHHLRILREAGLVDCYRKGTWAYYFTLPAALVPLRSILAHMGEPAASRS